MEDFEQFVIIVEAANMTVQPNVYIGNSRASAVACLEHIHPSFSKEKLNDGTKNKIKSFLEHEKDRVWVLDIDSGIVGQILKVCK